MSASVNVKSRTRPARPLLRLVIVLVALGVIGGGLIGVHQFKSSILKQVVAQIVSQLPTVSTTKAAVQTWQPTLQATGTLRASKGADLSAEVAGIVGELSFESGQDVAAGAPLLRLRANDDDAKLAQLQAAAELAGVTYQRDLKQFRAQGVAQSTVDTDASNLKSAQAQVAAQQALMAEKFVRAPFAGRLGLRQVDLGQFLSAGTKIVTLQALDPIYLDFYIPQQELGQIRTGEHLAVHVDAYPGRDFPGEISAINAEADSASRMIQVRATLANSDHALLPGMFATTVIDAGATQRLVTVPQTAVSANAYGSLVYIVHENGADGGGKTRLAVTQTFVTTGATRGDQIAILKGVADGDVVVTAGQLKLHNNSGVLVNNNVQPTDNPNPAPSDQ
jgi:membrane fusion protein (multidrug efflux system)